MSNSVRLALIGYGRIAPKHLEVFRALGCDVVASCNRSEAQRVRAQTEGGIARTYQSIEAMMEAEDPEGVVACPSFDQVYGVARRLLPYRRPILLEKPPGTSLAEVVALAAEADQFGTPVMVALNRRHYSVLQRAIEDAGGVERIDAVFVDWSENPEHLAARGLTPAQIGNWVFGNSLHGLDLLTLLAGSIPAPAVIGIDRGAPFRWFMALQGSSDRGVLATFQSSWGSPGRWRVTFCTRGRRYLLAPLESCSVQEAGSSSDRQIHPDPVDLQFKPGFYTQAKLFLQTIAGSKTPEGQGLRSTFPAMGLAEALQQSCRRPDRSSLPPPS